MHTVPWARPRTRKYTATQVPDLKTNLTLSYLLIYSLKLQFNIISRYQNMPFSQVQKCFSWLQQVTKHTFLVSCYWFYWSGFSQDIPQVSITHLIFQVGFFFHKYFHKRAPLSSTLPFIPLTVIHTLLLLLSFRNPHTCLCTSSEQTDLIYPCPQEVSQNHETTQRFDFEGHYIKKWIPWPCCPKIWSHQFLKELNPSNIQELYDHTTGISAGWLGDNTALAESISIDLGLVVKVCWISLFHSCTD